MPKIIEDIKCVVFDLDDTLHFETEYCKSGFRTVASVIKPYCRQSAEDIYMIMWDKFSQGARGNIFNMALDELKIEYDRQFLDLLVKNYREHFPKIDLPASSRNVLNALRGTVAMAMITNGFMPAQMYKVQALGIEDYFEKIVYTEQLGRDNWKPSTAGYELLMEHFGFEPNNYIYIGDNPEKDFEAPNKLGWRSVFINTGKSVHGNKPQNELQKAQFEINEISQLLGLLGYDDRN